MKKYIDIVVDEEQKEILMDALLKYQIIMKQSAYDFRTSNMEYQARRFDETAEKIEQLLSHVMCEAVFGDWGDNNE